MVSHGQERRRYGRIRLDLPISGRLNDLRVKVIEMSVVGFLVAHENRISPAPGETRTLTLEWQGVALDLDCEIVRSTLWRLARSGTDRSIYHSGLRVTGVSGDAFNLLREMIADRILAALEQQRANARGIPPLSNYMYQPEKGDLFRRCEMVGGKWRRSETVHSDQPENGFTVSAEVHPDHVEILCRTWEHTTAEGRRLTKLLAELSISKAEGIPTRRYVP